MLRAIFSKPAVYWLAVAATLVLEGATILARVLSGHSAAEFNAAVDPPLLLKMHHMFWALPVGLAAAWTQGRRSSCALWALAMALVASDLLHHALVLPLWVGNTGWHWP
jgi:hypothetical protein